MADRLIPAFPNEISILILPQLTFFDMLRGQRVSKLWNIFVKGDVSISEKLFLFPPHLRDESGLTLRQKYMTTYGKLLEIRKTITSLP
jgi:hypothetical protein